jgi:hypothetical protein
MLKEIFALLKKRPFEPFAVLTSDGHEYTVPTPNHASMNPAKTRLIIWTDADEVFHLSAVHIAEVRPSLAVDQD